MFQPTRTYKLFVEDTMSKRFDPIELEEFIAFLNNKKEYIVCTVFNGNIISYIESNSVIKDVAEQETFCFVIGDEPHRSKENEDWLKIGGLYRHMVIVCDKPSEVYLTYVSKSTADNNKSQREDFVATVLELFKKRKGTSNGCP